MRILLERTSMGRAFVDMDYTGRIEYSVEYSNGTIRQFSSRIGAVSALSSEGGVRDTRHGMDVVGGQHERI